MSYCSPERSSKKGTTTCLTLQELQLIAKDYNETMGKNVIPISKSKKKLYEDIRKQLSQYCGQNHNSDYCWIDQPFVSHTTKSQLTSAFRPKRPSEWYKNRYTWLNTFDILDVMKQYEMKYKDFSFMGVYPIDFQQTYPDNTNRCIGRVFCTFDIDRDVFAHKKKRFAFVLNLDRHNQSGSHWVAIYCNLDTRKPNYGIYYYDSVSSPPSQEVQKFMKKVAQQVSERNANKTIGGRASSRTSTQPKFELNFNTVQKQSKNTECGIFSIVFITQMLRQKYTFDFICDNMRRDDDMNSIRDVLYRPSRYNG
jgi:hypothetical protein